MTREHLTWRDHELCRFIDMSAEKEASVKREFRVGLVSLLFSFDNVQTSLMTNRRLTKHT